jgi:hypothetical protein
MTIKIHLFYSSFIHTIVLLYVLSLPIYKGSINLKSFENYFVNLTSEQGENAGKPPLTYKIKKSENKVPLEPPRVEKSLKKEIEAGKEKVIVLKGGITEVKVFEKAPQKVKEPPKPPLPETDTGLILKTMPGSMTMPFEEAFKEKSLHVKKEIETEKKEVHKAKEAAEDKAVSEKIKEVKEPSRIERVLKGKAPAIKEKAIILAKKEVHKAEELEAKEAVKPLVEIKPDEVTFDTPLEEEAPVLKEVSEAEEATKNKDKGFKEERVEVKVSEKETPPPTIHESFPETDAELSLKTINDNMMMPFEEIFKEELPAVKEIAVAKKETEKPQKGEKPDKEVFDTAVSSLETKGTPSPALPETDTGLILKTMPGKMMVPFEEGFKEENLQTEKEIETERKAGHGMKDVHSVKEKAAGLKEDKEESGVEILTPEKNRMPSQEDYFLSLGNSEKQITTEIKPGVKEEAIVGGGNPPLGIPVPDALLLKDIRIEVFLKDADMSDVLSHLFKKAHPMENRKDDSVNQKEIGVVEEKNIAGTSEIKKVLYVAKAEKGLYTFVIRNNGNKAYEADVVFRLFEKKAGERIKEYKTVELPPDTALKFKFILPEAVFWDDEYYFTGTIENSDTLSKFNDKTGLIWKEEKDY